MPTSYKGAPLGLEGVPVGRLGPSSLRPPTVTITGVTQLTPDSDPDVGVTISNHDPNAQEIWLVLVAENRIAPWTDRILGAGATSATVNIRRRRIRSGDTIKAMAVSVIPTDEDNGIPGDISLPSEDKFLFTSEFPGPGTDEPIAVTIMPAEGVVGDTFTAVVTGDLGDPAGETVCEWSLDDDPIEGVTGTNCVAPEAGALKVKATVRNDHGSAIATSAAVTVSPAPAAPYFGSEPAIEVDTAEVGGKITVAGLGDPGGYPPPVLTISVLRDGSPIEGATDVPGALGELYTFVEDDELHAITVEFQVLQESTGAYELFETDAVVVAPAPAAPSVIAPPVVSGEGRVGAPLLVTFIGEFGGWPVPDVSGSWQSRLSSGAWADIPGAVELSFTAPETLAGSAARWRSRATNTSGEPADAYSNEIEFPAAGGIAYVTKSSSNGSSQNISATQPGDTAFAIPLRVTSGLLPSVPVPPEIAQAWLAPADTDDVDPTHSGTGAGRLLYKRPAVSGQGSGVFPDAQRIVLPIYRNVREVNPIKALKWASGTGTEIAIPALGEIDSETAWIVVGWSHGGTTPAVAAAGWGTPGTWAAREHGNNRATYDSNGPMLSFDGATATLATAANWVAYAFVIERTGVSDEEEPEPEPGEKPELVTRATISGGNTVGSVLTRVPSVYSGTPTPEVAGFWRANGEGLPRVYGPLDSRLHFAPPAQTSPDAYTLTQGHWENNGVSGRPNTFGTDQDVILNPYAGTRNARLIVRGGRHVRIIGGDLDQLADVASSRAMAVVDVTGSIFIEGQRIDVTNSPQFIDALAAGGTSRFSAQTRFPDLYIQNCNILGVKGLVAGLHADGVQHDYGLTNLYMDRVDIQTNYQGLFLRQLMAPNGNPISGVIDLRRLYLYRSGLAEGDDPNDQSLIYFAIDVAELLALPTQKIRMTDVWVQVMSGDDPTRAIRPASAAATGSDGVSNYLHWPDYPSLIVDAYGQPARVRYGAVPPGGGFSRGAGASYVSPGYRSGAAETGANYTINEDDQQAVITWFDTGTNEHGSASAASEGVLVPLVEPDDPDPEPERPAALTAAQWSVYGVEPDPAVPSDPRRAGVIAIPPTSPAFASDNVRWQVAGDEPADIFARAMTLKAGTGPLGEKLWRTTSAIPATDPACPHLRAPGSIFQGVRVFYTIDGERSHPSTTARNIPVPEILDPDPDPDPDPGYAGWNIVDVNPSNHLQRYAAARTGRTVYRLAPGVYEDFYWPSNITDFDIAIIPLNRHNPPTIRAMRIGAPSNLMKGNFRHLVGAAKGTNFNKKIILDGLDLRAVRFTSTNGVSTITGPHAMPDAATEGGLGWRVYRVVPPHPSGSLVGSKENAGYNGLGFYGVTGTVEVKNCLLDGYSISLAWYPGSTAASIDIHHNDIIGCEDLIKFDGDNITVRDNFARGRPPTPGIADASGGPSRPHGDFIQAMGTWTRLYILRNAIIDPSGHLAGGQIKAGAGAAGNNSLLWMEGNELRSSANTAWWINNFERNGSGIDGSGYDVIIRGNKHWQYPGVPWLEGNPSVWGNNGADYSNARVLIDNNVGARLRLGPNGAGVTYTRNIETNNGTTWPIGWKNVAKDRVAPGQPYSGRYGATAGVIPN